MSVADLLLVGHHHVLALECSLNFLAGLKSTRDTARCGHKVVAQHLNKLVLSMKYGRCDTGGKSDAAISCSCTDLMV